MTIELEVENLGPIATLEIKLEHGINVATGPNGSGKTHLLEGVSHLATGKGGLPLKDGESRGFIAGAGARLSIGAKSTRATGEFELVHLEGKFDLGKLVDPGIKDPKAADGHRIRSLVQIMGVTADVKRFADKKLFPDFDKIMPEKIEEHTDLVDQALAVKRSYEESARIIEGTAERECGKAESLERDGKATDTNVETDDKALMARYDAAKEKVTTLSAQVSAYGNAKAKEADAKLRLEELEAVNVQAAEEAATAATKLAGDAKGNLAYLLEQVRQQEIELDKLNLKRQGAEDAAASARRAAKLIAENERVIEELSAVTNPDTKEVAAAEAELAEAKAAIEAGVVAREAARKLQEAKAHRNEEKSLRARSEAYRAAAKNVDLVLSDAIQCDLLKVESHDGVARLMTYHPLREKYIPFHDLSHGEKWNVALQLGCDRVGENGVLPISQESWEGLDAFVRPELIAYAKKRKVYVLTAEATRDAEEGDELTVKSLEA